MTSVFLLFDQHFRASVGSKIDMQLPVFPGDI
jgi:hypothetical protein